MTLPVMANVLHVPAFQDNYIWLIRGDAGNSVAIVDPGDADPVIHTLEAQGLRPVAILCTHHHRDHVGGVPALVQRYRVPVYGPRREVIAGVTVALDEGGRIDIPTLGVSLEVMEIPGHTLGHIAYYGSGMLFCGDTLFSAGCGKLFEGTPEQMHASLTRLAALAPDTRVYCGHEYTAANLRFAQTVEPDNRDAREHMQRVLEWRADHRPSLPSTIAMERRINPFLRITEPTVHAAVQSHTKRSLGSTVEIFAALRRWKDSFQG